MIQVDSRRARSFGACDGAVKGVVGVSRRRELQEVELVLEIRIERRRSLKVADHSGIGDLVELDALMAIQGLGSTNISC